MRHISPALSIPLPEDSDVQFDYVPILIKTVEDVDRHLDLLRKSAISAHGWITAQTCDPFELLRRMKFDAVGFHPIENHALNLVEQINQTWTYAVALEATRKLLGFHPGVGGFRLSPGAYAEMPLDILSVDESVGAETFATVNHVNNRKLERDLSKMAARNDLRHRYVFFMSPQFRATERLTQFERGSVQVWSVNVR